MNVNASLILARLGSQQGIAAEEQMPSTRKQRLGKLRAGDIISGKIHGHPEVWQVRKILDAPEFIVVMRYDLKYWKALRAEAAEWAKLRAKSARKK
jgi:hypothetical protein